MKTHPCLGGKRAILTSPVPHIKQPCVALPVIAGQLSIVREMGRQPLLPSTASTASSTCVQWARLMRFSECEKRL